MINILGLVLAEIKNLDEAQSALNEANFIDPDESSNEQIVLESIDAINIVYGRILVAITDLTDYEVALIEI